MSLQPRLDAASARAGNAGLYMRAQPRFNPVVGRGRQWLEPPVAFQKGIGQGQALITPDDFGRGFWFRSMAVPLR